MDRIIHPGMCYMPTKQNMHAPSANPILSHINQGRNPPLPNSGHGSHHKPTPQSRQRCHPYDCRPWVHQGSHLPTLQNNHIKRRSSDALSREHVPMVWPTSKNHFGQRSPPHIPFCKGTVNASKLNKIYPQLFIPKWMVSPQ